MELREMGIGHRLASVLSKYGTQTRPIVGLLPLDDQAVEKVGRYVLINLIDK
jgi:hypothetical protein